MLTTLKAWMTAREANASAAVVQESDASFVGDARDYDAVLAALLGDDDTSPQAPEGWDVVKMDLGRVGGKRGDGTSDGIKPEERSAPATTLTFGRCRAVSVPNLDATERETRKHANAAAGLPERVWAVAALLRGLWWVG